MIYLKNKDGEKSITFTMTVVAFTLISLWLVLFVVCPLFGITSIPAFDSAVAMGYLSPILAAYTARKYTDSKSRSNNNTTNSNRVSQVEEEA